MAIGITISTDLTTGGFRFTRDDGSIEQAGNAQIAVAFLVSNGLSEEEAVELINSVISKARDEAAGKR